MRLLENVQKSVTAAAIALVALVALAAIAIPATQLSGKNITQVKTVREPGGSATSSSTLVDLPNATTTLTVPAGTTAMILAQFTAESACLSFTTRKERSCFVRILIGGSPAPPGTVIFDTGNTVDVPETHATDASRGPLGPGTYTVTVQYAAEGQVSTFRLSHWHLTAETVRVSG